MSAYPTVFTRVVRDFAGPPPPLVGPTDSCAATVAAMNEADSTSAIVTDPEKRPLGIVTEQDVTRRITYRTDAETDIAKVMTAPLLTVDEDEYVYHAIARMRRADLRHMPVTGDGGAVTGILHLDDALAGASEGLVTQIDRLTHEATPEGVRAVKTAQVEVALQLLEEGVPAHDVQQLLSHINRDIHRRLTELSLDEMRGEGMGDPPVGFSVLVMGSAGRGESFLYPDQDNGFVLDDYPDCEHDRIDAFFIELAERLTRRLDDVGFPYCNGFVMATNPVWRKTLPQWRGQIDYWARHRSLVATQLSDIFFDFRGVCGDLSLVHSLREYVTDVMPRHHAYLQAMFEGNADSGTVLGLFGRLRVEKAAGPNRGRLNLKHAGTLPLVSAARLLALRAGISAVSTLRRLDALRDANVVDADTHEYLTSAYHHICHLILRQQLTDFQNGHPVGNFVSPKSLSRRERSLLVEGLRSIQSFKDFVRSEFTGDVF